MAPIDGIQTRMGLMDAMFQIVLSQSKNDLKYHLHSDNYTIDEREMYSAL